MHHSVNRLLVFIHKNESMIKTFTSLEIISFLYNESDPKTAYMINEMLSNDWNALGKFNQLKKAQHLLEPLSFSPSQDVVKNILLESVA